jgi:hypothetical protein
MKNRIITLLTITALIALATIGIQPVKAQRLLVKYDLLTNRVSYFNVNRTGDESPISKPVVRKNHTVEIRVINFNPFLYNGSVQIDETKVAETANINFMSLLSPLSMSATGGNFLQQLSSEGVSRGGIFSDRQAKKSYDQVQKAYQNLYRTQNVIRNIDFTVKKLKQLQLNPYLPSDSIKAQSMQLIRSLLLTDEVNSVEFSNIMAAIHGDVNRYHVELKQAASQFQKSYDKYVQFNGKENSFEGEGLDAQVRELLKDAENFTKSFDISRVGAQLDRVERMYQAISNTPFVFNTNYLAQGDGARVKLTFDHKYDNEEGDQAGDLYKEVDFQLFVRGDFKINSSIGLAFPYHNENDLYINRDSMVTRVDGNNYTPNLSAYLNFYPYTGRSVQVGGTFGVGVPISNDNRNFNFLLGGSVLLGDDSKLVLHGGVVLGQIKKLDNGYQVGDNLGSTSVEVPLTNDYQWGGFVGISFSILNVNQ